MADDLIPPSLPSKQPTSFSKMTTFVLPILVLGLAIGLSFFIKKEAKPENPSPSKTLEPQPKTNEGGGGILNTLKNKSKLSIPPIASTEDITLSALPAVLQKLVPEEGKNSRIQKVKFVGGGMGYQISYKIQKPIQADFNTLESNLDYITVSTRAESAAFLEGFMGIYEMRVAMNGNKESYQATITILQTK